MRPTPASSIGRTGRPVRGSVELPADSALVPLFPEVVDPSTAGDTDAAPSTAAPGVVEVDVAAPVVAALVVDVVDDPATVDDVEDEVVDDFEVVEVVDDGEVVVVGRVVDVVLVDVVVGLVVELEEVVVVLLLCVTVHASPFGSDVDAANVIGVLQNLSTAPFNEQAMPIRYEPVGRPTPALPSTLKLAKLN